MLHDQENTVNFVQTFLRKFNHYSFFETPKVLLLAWDRVFKIKDAPENKQYKPDDTQEFFRKLFNDVQNIHKELAEYINTPGWNRPAFYDDDDDDVDYTIAITPVLSIEEPDNSLSMGDEHLDTISATESDEVLKSSVENLILIPINLLIAKIEELNDNPTLSSDCKTKSPSTSLNSLLKETNTFDNSLPGFETFCFDAKEISSGSTTTHYDNSLPEYEVFYDDHVKEISSGSPTTYSDSSLYASFLFDLSINPFPPTDRSNFYEFIDELIPFYLHQSMIVFSSRLNLTRGISLRMWWRIFL
uniref:Reverse transcriptase domain-containing protein n=1 Tax=Tanacetum cinerariifolium TaxID=118510 RepID=A0A699HVI4_TANCI|nr:hypothetical protein [Tanacetum cinerariifolium]